MDEEGLNKFKLKTPSITIAYRKSSSVEITDADKLPKKYKTVVVEEKPNKIKLKEYLETQPNKECKFAKINSNINMSIK